MYKILIVEDDETIANLTQEFLRRWEFEVECAADFRNVLEKVTLFEPHLILMDVILPYFNGFHWCAEIRKTSQTPIIFISSASDNMNVVMAMNMGGDDFIAKPFDLNVLVAKIQALMRRAYSFAGQARLIEHNGLILNLGDTTLSYKNKKIELTKNDFRILQTLMENPGNVVSREDIMVRLWESDCFIDDNTLTVNITRLRKKLEELEIADLIKTKKGIGYMVE